MVKNQCHLLEDKQKVYCAYKKLVSISALRPHPRNINRHSQSQIVILANLIQYHGWRSPITVSNLSGYVVRGHGRLAAAKHLGLKTVPVDYQDYVNEVDEVADLIADNKVHDYSEVDIAAMKGILEEYEDDTSLDLANFGFIEAEINMLTADMQRELDNGVFINENTTDGFVPPDNYKDEKKKKKCEPNKTQSFICPKCGFVSLK